jgi:hypothetical protein
MIVSSSIKKDLSDFYHYSFGMNKTIASSNSTVDALLHCPDFLMTPPWGEYFYYLESRETLINLYEGLIDAGFHLIEQPHEVFSGSYVAKLKDRAGREILLRSK